MTKADKGMNPLCFGSDLMDIRMCIHLEIQIRIPDHFWMRRPKLGGSGALGAGGGMQSLSALSLLIFTLNE